MIKKKKYRETSKLITIFSENSGKINLIAKGVRNPKSKISAVLEPINLIEFVYYNKPTRDLQYISSADFVKDFPRIKSDFEKIKIAYAIIELTNLFSHEGEKNSELYDLVENSLISLDKYVKSNFLLFVNFLIRLCEIVGYPIYSGQCPVCHRVLDITQHDFFFTRDYGLVCGECRNMSIGVISLGTETKKFLSELLKFTSFDLMLEDKKIQHLYLPILEFLQFHVEEIKKLKSLELF